MKQFFQNLKAKIAGYFNAHPGLKLVTHAAYTAFGGAAIGVLSPILTAGKIPTVVDLKTAYIAGAAAAIAYVSKVIFFGSHTAPTPGQPNNG